MSTTVDACYHLTSCKVEKGGEVPIFSTEGHTAVHVRLRADGAPLDCSFWLRPESLPLMAAVLEETAAAVRQEIENYRAHGFFIGAPKDEEI